MLMLPALLLVSGLSGCGKEDTPPPPRKTRLTGGGGSGDGGKAAAKTTIKPGGAKISGRVVLAGEAPKPASLEAKMKEHNDKATCLAGEAFEKMDQTWMIGKDKGVANAVVWLSPPDGSDFDVVNSSGDAAIDQPHCVYIPHVVVVKPGQKLLVKNSANVIHNTNLAVDPLVNVKGFGQAIPAGKTEVVDWLKPQDSPIAVGCQFHNWMSAKIWILPHQYVAVTDKDGNFTIESAPEGTELSVVAWHEGASPNYFYGGKKGTKHTFKGGANDLKLEVKAP
jgi:hypothetical protein